MQLKERKEMEEAFRKAQKPWAKFLQKVNKTKLDYHNACKNEKSAINMERNASGDSSVSTDQVIKDESSSSYIHSFIAFMSQNHDCETSSSIIWIHILLVLEPKVDEDQPFPPLHERGESGEFLLFKMWFEWLFFLIRTCRVRFPWKKWGSVLIIE